MLNFETRRKHPTLLLIDDDLISREVTATVLTMSGYPVHTAVDGERALEMLTGQECAPDVILMDAQMPGLSGTELIAELRTRTKARVFAISGSNPLDTVAAAADGFLLKPFDAEALEKALEGHPIPGAISRKSHLDPKDPVISLETLAQFRGMMPEAAVREIYAAVAADLARRIQTLEAAIARGDDGRPPVWEPCLRISRSIPRVTTWITVWLCSAICVPPPGTWSVCWRQNYRPNFGHFSEASFQMERPIRIVLADDHPVVRIGVRNMLVEQDGFEVVGEATDGDEAITQTLELQPDILLLDVQMPRLPGLEAMRAIMNGTATVKILLLTSTITTQQIIEALHIGARGIVLKDALASHLQTAIRTVSTGDYWIGGKRVVNLVSALHDLMQQAAVPQHKTYGLTPRELEVVGCIVEGCSNRDIAKQFNLSEETVKRHLSNIFDKTGVSTRLELALFAIAHTLVTPQ
jgi:DNA-binding NarL/FixJ family response regulator